MAEKAELDGEKDGKYDEEQNDAEDTRAEKHHQLALGEVVLLGLPVAAAVVVPDGQSTGPRRSRCGRSHGGHGSERITGAAKAEAERRVFSERDALGCHES